MSSPRCQASAGVLNPAPLQARRGASYWPSPEAAPFKRQPTAQNGSTRMVLFPIFFFFICFFSSVNYFFTCVYILFWLCWVFLAVPGLSLVAAIGSYSLFRCSGFSLRWLLLLQSADSRCTGFSSWGSRAPEPGLSSCGTLVFAWRHVGSSRPRIEPVSPTLAGGFFTTEPPKKALTCFFNIVYYFSFDPFTSKAEILLIIKAGSFSLLI